MPELTSISTLYRPPWSLGVPAITPYGWALPPRMGAVLGPTKVGFD